MASTSHIPGHWQCTTPAEGGKPVYIPNTTLVLCCGRWQACTESHVECKGCGTIYTDEGKTLLQTIQALNEWAARSFKQWQNQHTERQAPST